ncbi:MAG: DUF4339 domain-containing protein [Pirellulales bacterium]|nr:DUF4339 domain-containing protein [Pirellulales bacterium]
MSQKIWHYTVGDDQFGPVTNDELKRLATAGTIKPTDQVWKEGMDDWMPASKVEALFSTKAGEMPIKPHGKRKLNMPKSLDPLSHIQPYGHAILMFGFLLVVLSRGCDSIGNRYVARAKAKYSTAQNDFRDSAERARQNIQAKIDREKEDDDPDNDRIKKYEKDLKELREEQSDEERDLRKGAWRDLQIASRDAAADNAMSGYWHEMLFVIGTMAFVVGLITVGFRGEGSEKTICLIMLAIVTVSLYVVGTPWVGSLPGLFGR